MQLTAIIGILLLGVVVSVECITCLTCNTTQTAGIATDNACLTGQTAVSQTSSDSLCITTGYFTINKTLTKLTRASTQPTQLTVAHSNNTDCFQSVDFASGSTTYMVVCTCTYPDNCNDFVINNCKCEKPAAAVTTTVTPSANTTAGATAMTIATGANTTAAATTANYTASTTGATLKDKVNHAPSINQIASHFACLFAVFVGALF